MDLYRTIAGQIDVVGLPLFAVTLTAVPRPNTPALLMLHWHAFRPTGRRRQETPRARRIAASVPSSALQINEPWQALSLLDQAMLDAAWQLGAWDLAREGRRGCNAPGAAEREALECRRAFGDDPLRPFGETHATAEAPDREDLMHLGARIGYMRWEFRPVRYGLWRQTAADDTLAADGGRALPCPCCATSMVSHCEGATRVRLGKVGRLILV